MIELIKRSILSFCLKTDIQGVEEILRYIRRLNEKDVKYPEILYSEKILNFEIKLESDIDELLIERSAVKMYLDSDELEYLKQRLENALINKCFYPAEICERKYKNKYVTIYCDLIV